MRPIQKMIEAIKKLTPEDVPERTDLFYDLDELLSQAENYKSPEQLAALWQGLVEALTLDLGDPDADWKKKIADVMSSKIDYRDILED